MGKLINGRTTEDLKDALMRCGRRHCKAESGDCPYYIDCLVGATRLKLMKDAFDYIRYLEAEHDAALAKPLQRPMTLEETWEKSKEVSDNVVWLEFKEEHEDYLYVIPALISNTAPWPFGMNHLPTIRYFRFLVWPKDIIEVEKEKYGEKHRCWASKPTDEERAAAKWEV